MFSLNELTVERAVAAFAESGITPERSVFLRRMKDGNGNLGYCGCVVAALAISQGVDKDVDAVTDWFYGPKRFRDGDSNLTRGFDRLKHDDAHPNPKLYDLGRRIAAAVGLPDVDVLSW